MPSRVDAEPLPCLAALCPCPADAASPSRCRADTDSQFLAAATISRADQRRRAAMNRPCGATPSMPCRCRARLRLRSGWPCTADAPSSSAVPTRDFAENCQCASVLGRGRAPPCFAMPLRHSSALSPAHALSRRALHCLRAAKQCGQCRALPLRISAVLCPGFASPIVATASHCLSAPMRCLSEPSPRAAGRFNATATQFTAMPQPRYPR